MQWQCRASYQSQSHARHVLYLLVIFLVQSSFFGEGILDHTWQLSGLRNQGQRYLLLLLQAPIKDLYVCLPRTDLWH